MSGDNTPTNVERAAWGALLLGYYRSLVKDQPDEANAVDAIADILHFETTQERDARDVCEKALLHHETELRTQA